MKLSINWTQFINNYQKSTLEVYTRLLICNPQPKIKSHVVESQITFLVWPCLTLTEKQHTVKHMIIFNVFTSAAFEAFAEAYLCFFVSSSTKKNAEAIKFLGILKKIRHPEWNMYFFEK